MLKSLQKEEEEEEERVISYVSSLNSRFSGSENLYNFNIFAMSETQFPMLKQTQNPVTCNDLLPHLLLKKNEINK